MTQTQNLMELNDKQYQLLKREYIEAVKQKKEQFSIQGQPVLTKFAKYWIEGVEGLRKKRGLRIYNPKIDDKKCPICQYKWTKRIENPKVCPRCKNRLDIARKVEATQ